MDLKELQIIREQLSEFIELFKPELGRKERVHWCTLYTMGLIQNGDRKSIEPMAQRLPGGNEQALQQFVNQSPWDYIPVQKKLAEFLVKKIEAKNGVLILDDTSLPKKGKCSVGVSHQYCGALGKIANCQSIVSWHYAEKNSIHFPVNAELFLPKSWTTDKERMKQAHVPRKRYKFQKKWEIALALLDSISQEHFPYNALVFDAGYGEVREFLQEIDNRRLKFVAQIPESHSFWPENITVNNVQKTTGRPRQYPEIANKKEKPKTGKQWLISLLAEDIKWTKIKLPLESKKYTEVIAIPVKETITKAFYRPGVSRLLVIEKIGNNSYKYFITNALENTPIEEIVLWIHERWKIEQGYQHLKEELGLDHFEGRSWLGLHHHITLCYLAYGFLTLIRQEKKGKKNPDYFSNRSKNI